MENIENVRKSWYKKWWGILIISTIILIIIIGIAIAWISFKLVSVMNDSDFAPEISQVDIGLINGNPANYSLGTTSPLIIIIEFSDFACPYCYNSFSTIREISVKYQDKIKYIHRYYPVVTEHSSLLAQAAHCAGDEGRFWAMHDALFLNQGIDSQTEIIELAQQIGADGVKINDCLSQEKYLSVIEKDFVDGQKLGITGTPTWFINNYRVSGDIPRDKFLMFINELLSNLNQNN